MILVEEFKERAHLFKNRSYLFFTLSGMFATLGNGLNYIALSWLAYHQSNSMGGVAMMMFFLWTPSIVFAPLFGLLADRYNKKFQIVLSNSARGLALLIFVLLWHIGIHVHPAFLYATLGIFIAFYMPCAVPFIHAIVPKEKLVIANTTIDMIYELGTIIGMGISGVLIALFGMKWTLGLGGVLFIISGLLNLPMRSQEQNSLKEEESKSWLQDYTSSLRYFMRTPALFMPYISQMMIMVLVMIIPVILVPYTREILHASTRTFALYEALYSIGALVGGGVSPLLCKKMSIDKTLSVLLFIMAVGLFVLSNNSTIALVFPVYFMIGFGLSCWGLSITLAQLHCTHEYQGRLQATFNGISGLFILALYLLMAHKGHHISPQLVYFFLSMFALCGFLIVLLFRRRRRRQNI